MNIPDKAVEAAARAEYLSPTPGLEFAVEPEWESLSEHEQQHWLDDVRASLEAAAPFIRAEALREFASQVVHDDPDDDRWRWETSDVADAARAYARELDPS